MFPQPPLNKAVSRLSSESTFVPFYIEQVRRALSLSERAERQLGNELNFRREADGEEGETHC